MSDRELLEAAAKAAGLRIYTERQAERDAAGISNVGLWLTTGHTCWNPLTDNGDALRLAIKLGLDISFKAFGEDAVMVSDSEDRFQGWFDEAYGDDKDAAVRRCIVRAAAELAPKEAA